MKRSVGSLSGKNGSGVPWKTAAVLMTLALMTGCQSKYKPVEIGAAQTEGVQESGQAGETAIQSSNMSQGPGAAGPGSAVQNAGAESSQGAEGQDAAVNAAQNAGPGAAAQETEAGTASQEAGTEAAAQSTGAEALTAKDETVYVTGSGVNLRSTPGTDGDIVGKVGLRTSMKRIGVTGDWSKVVYQDKECYIKSEFVTTEEPEALAPTNPINVAEGEVTLNPNWQYAGYSKINSGAARMYKSTAANRYGIVVCVNAGHGTNGGGSVKTQCHPDGTPKVTGGSTAAGAVSAAAVSSGMVFADGTPEAKVTLAMALKFRDKLLAAGYDVLMIRDTDDVQLDNVARTVIANNNAHCHIAIHWDSSTSDKGAFYCSVPNVASYRSMEPVRSHWEQHHALGDSMIAGLRSAGVKIYGSGSAAIDLTQTSYSTIPSIDIELGDKVSDHSDAALDRIATGMVAGINTFFQK